MILFPFNDYWFFYVGFTVFVLFMLALDLGFFHKKAHEVSIKEASIWTGVWIGLALIFNYLFYLYSSYLFNTDIRFTQIPGFNPSEQAQNLALQFLTGFIVEKSLAIDNIFIFAVVFSYFSIPKVYQHRVLFWGVVGALIFRAIFIAMGSVLMSYHWVIILFGLLLIFTGIKMFFAGAKTEDLENNMILKILKRIFRVHPVIYGQNFFVKKNGLIYVTPLFLALIFLELSDIIFAIDSVPAIFSISKEPLIVFTSNIFAILGLRSMYFMLASVIDRFIYIKYGLASVLIFVGLKMVWLNQLFDGKFPITWSLFIISFLIGSSVFFSVLREKWLQNFRKQQNLNQKIFSFFIFCALFTGTASWGQVQYSNKTLKNISFEQFQQKFGLSYFSFWEGPSLEDGLTARNELSNPLDTGLSLFNLVSVKYKLNSSYSIDLQNRLELIHTQDSEWRFQGIRAGLSGTLLKGKSWNLNGAVNTDVPELNGRDARARTVVFNPGLFAGLTWNIDPKWSLYTILSPRIFFYRDDQAVEREWLLAGRDPGEKPRAIIQAFPTLNYAFNDTFGLRSGLDMQFRQFVESSPTYFKRWPTSWTLGPTFNLNKMLSTYFYVQTWPFDGKGLTRETSSLGMWLSGIIF
jgi:tellurite resistance protein TerC